MVLILIFGSLNTIVIKSMDQVVTPNGKFNHPYFQSLIMFMGELICLPIYLLKSKEINSPFLMAIPAILDVFGSSLMFIALTLCAASVY